MVARASLLVRVTPRASRSVVAGYTEGVLHVRVTAPPVGGAANEAVLRLVSRALGVAPGKIAIVSGAASRTKRLAIEGLDEAALAHRLTLLAKSGPDDDD